MLATIFLKYLHIVILFLLVFSNVFFQLPREIISTFRRSIGDILQMKKIGDKTWLLITTLFAVVVTTYVLSTIVTAPWHVVPELGGDGGKNIFTYLYHVLYDKGIWFTGMNYPYGEHIVFTDGQPLLSVLLGYVGGRSIETALTVMWWLVALSYILSIVYCYKILTYFKVTPVLAMCFGALIAVFSPQLLRIAGHYALSYSCILPMLFYWTIQYNARFSWRFPLYIFFLGTITTFLHPYYAAVSLVWVGAYAVGFFSFTKASIAKKASHVAPLLIGVMCVFFVFYGFMKVTDPATDRPSTPFGILENGTHIKDIMSSAYTPAWGYLLNHHVFSKISNGGEGYNYAGMAILVTVFISFVAILRRKAAVEKVAPGFNRIWLFMAFGVLLFSMGVPFIWHMQFLLNYVSLLRQFRTLGRFSWIFYYIITVYGSVVICHAFARLKAAGQGGKAYVLLFGALGIWLFEAGGYVAHAHETIAPSQWKYEVLTGKNEEGWQHFLATTGHKSQDFQAIMVLPFFETGSEKLWMCSNIALSDNCVNLGVKAGLQLHLPIVDVMMSRSAWGQAFKQAKTVGGPFSKKPMLLELPDARPFLLVNLDNDTLSPDQQYLFAASDSIGHFQNCTVYACYPLRILANDQKAHDEVAAATAGYSIGDTCIRYAGPWFVNHFDNEQTLFPIFGIGAQKYHDGDSTIINTIPVTPARANQLYEFSCWFLLSAKDYKSPSVVLQVLDEKGNIVTHYESYTKESADNHGMWFRNGYYFNLPSECRAVRCWVKNMPADSYLFMDELLLRPADAIIISKSRYVNDDHTMVNNHIY